MGMIRIPLALCFSLSALMGTAEEAEKGVEEDFEALVAAGKEKLPGLRLELSTAKNQYELGEPIEVIMRYTYTGDRNLAVLRVTGDRCGRIPHFGFSATDERGNAVRDPIDGHLWATGGGGWGGASLTRQEP